MGAFLLLTWVGGHWPNLYAASYLAKTIAAAGLLIYFRNHYTSIRWNYWWLGVIVGIIGVVQWVGMEKFLLHIWPNYPRPGTDVFIPGKFFTSSATMWIFIIIRWLGASLVRSVRRVNKSAGRSASELMELRKLLPARNGFAGWMEVPRPF